MDTTSSANDLSSPGKTEISSALRDWLDMLTLFRAYNDRLCTYINAPDTGLPLIGQCPRLALTKLLAAMHWELATILLEVEQQSPPSTSEQEVERLRAHTARLAPFNQQAGQLLTLTER